MSGPKGQAGFTLLEMMLACSLVVMVTLAVIPFIWQAKAITQQNQRQVELHKSLQIGMEKMTSELLSCDSLTFYKPQQGYQPLRDDNHLRMVVRGKEVHYFVNDNGALARSFVGVKGQAALPVNQHVKELAVKYFNHQGQPLAASAAASEVVRVQLTLTAGMDGTEEESFTSSVALRVTTRHAPEVKE